MRLRKILPDIRAYPVDQSDIEDTLCSTFRFHSNIHVGWACRTIQPCLHIRNLPEWNSCQLVSSHVLILLNSDFTKYMYKFYFENLIYSNWILKMFPLKTVNGMDCMSVSDSGGLPYNTKLSTLTGHKLPPYDCGHIGLCDTLYLFKIHTRLDSLCPRLPEKYIDRMIILYWLSLFVFYGK